MPQKQTTGDSYCKCMEKDCTNIHYVDCAKHYIHVQHVTNFEDAAEMLWFVLANVSGGDWTKQTEEWQKAARRWANNYLSLASKDRGVSNIVAKNEENIADEVVSFAISLIVCECGHPKKLHLSRGLGICDQKISTSEYCHCTSFVAKNKDSQ